MYKVHLVVFIVSTSSDSCTPCQGINSPRAGLMSIKTRRSAWDSGTRFPARSRFGRIDLYFHTLGMVVGLGAGGFSRAICFHRGRVLLASRSARSFSSESTVVASVVDMVASGILCFARNNTGSASSSATSTLKFPMIFLSPGPGLLSSDLWY